MANCSTHSINSTGEPLPTYLKPDEAALLLRTSRKAIYSMIERRQMPGVCRIGRRVLIKRADLVDFLDHNTARRR